MASTFLAAVLALCACVYAIPPPGSNTVLIIHDESNQGVSVEAFSNDLNDRGYTVETKQLKEHPVLSEFGERSYDNVVVIPGKLKGFGKQLRAQDFIDHMKQGGNLLLLSTPQYSPAIVREIGQQLGFSISSKGVEYRSDFIDEVRLPYPQIVSSASELVGSAVAKIDTDNELLMGLVQGVRSSYSYNAKRNAPANSSVTDVFALGTDNYLAVGMQSLNNARFAWVGSSDLISGSAGFELTNWVFKESGNLRLDWARHSNVLNSSELFYNVDEPLNYCAKIEEWDHLVGEWKPFRNMSDVQIEFRMLDPYYRLNLNESGCVSFTAPEQYGMFTFALDYMRRGYTFLKDHQIVTVLQRSNDAWDRSWTITNSWVYLGGVTTSVMGFLVFVVLYLASPAPEKEFESKKDSKDSAANDNSETAVSTAVPEPQSPKKKSEKKTRRHK